MELKSNHGRSRLDINGALSWPDRTLVHRQEDLITSEAMIRLYDDLCARHPKAERITIVLDNARYNLSRKIKAYLAKPECRVKLVYLPFYAPDLSLIERFWHFMKRKVLFNKAYAKFATFAKAFDDFFENLNQYEAELKSLITDRFHFIGNGENGIHPA